MSKPKLEGRALHDTHKLVYLATEYPDKKIKELGQLFEMTMFDVNAAIWRAQDMGWLKVDQETGAYTVEKAPSKWDFGPAVAYLEETIVYVFRKLAEGENDLEDNDFGTWIAGAKTHDAVVALKHLINERVLASYEVTTEVEMDEAENTEETYTFYTLFENLEHLWGRKQFKDQSKLK